MRERRRGTAYGLLAATALACVGCSDSTGTVQGGEYLLASDAGTSAEAATSADVDVSAEASAEAGGSWKDLYATYFGPSGSASCSGSSCHGTSGAAAANWVCGESATSCWQGITVSVVPKGGATDWTTTTLYKSLRKDGCSASAAACNMPISSQTVTFTTADLARIGAWVQSGAANN